MIKIHTKKIKQNKTKNKDEKKKSNTKRTKQKQVQAKPKRKHKIKQPRNSSVLEQCVHKQANKNKTQQNKHQATDRH